VLKGRVISTPNHDRVRAADVAFGAGDARFEGARQDRYAGDRPVNEPAEIARLDSAAARAALTG
jgi:hypothetical protein